MKPNGDLEIKNENKPSSAENFLTSAHNNPISNPEKVFVQNQHLFLLQYFSLYPVE